MHRTDLTSPLNYVSNSWPADTEHFQPWNQMQPHRFRTKFNLSTGSVCWAKILALKMNVGVRLVTS